MHLQLYGAVGARRSYDVAQRRARLTGNVSLRAAVVHLVQPRAREPRLLEDRHGRRVKADECELQQPADARADCG